VICAFRELSLTLQDIWWTRAASIPQPAHCERPLTAFRANPVVMTFPGVYTATTAWNKKPAILLFAQEARLQKDSLERSSMLDSLQVIAELLRVFAFSLLGITLGVVVYALLQVFLQGVTRQREPRNGSGHGNTRCDNQEREAPINWHDFQTTPHISAGFTRDAK